MASLLIGFGPVIALFALFVALTFLYSNLLWTAEEILVDDDACRVPRSHASTRWLHVTLCPFLLLAYLLSLREHSPPFGLL